MYIISVTAISVLFLLYGAFLAIYRLFFSPVAKFPGRRLAALTFWYEFYYDVILVGQYTKQIARMHEEYGPIVRINPYELHIKDLDFYDSVYVGNASGRRVDKWAWQAKLFGVSADSFSTIDHDLHHSRRAPLANMFSKRAVSQLEPLLCRHVDKLLSRMEASRGTGTVLNLTYVYAGLTSDIISDYSFGLPLGSLDSPSFGQDLQEMVVQGCTSSALFKQCGWIFPLLQKLPDRVLLTLNPQLSQLFRLKGLMEDKLVAVRSDSKADSKMTHRTIFHELFDSSLPVAEKSIARMGEEGQTLVSAGTVTTADTLGVISFHIINNPSVLLRLQEELSPFGIESKGWKLQELERLPYLTALVKEGLRISYGIGQRLPRVFPDAALNFKEWVIPPGTPVSMSAIFMHDDPNIFPNPRTFSPERWLVSTEQRLEKYLVSFSKGTRQCLGINLAYAEMYLALAAMFAPGRFKFELFETTERDVEPVRDIFIPGLPPDSKGIRVTVQ